MREALNSLLIEVHLLLASIKLARQRPDTFIHSMVQFFLQDVICLSYHSWLDLAAGLFSRKNLARWLVSQLEYGEGSGNAAKEDQSEADELENAHMRAVARRLERNAHHEEEGGPQWDCP
jgi:hypothetical protein